MAKTFPIAKAPDEDSIGIKGCSHIYAPAGQAGEYAPLATNPYRGCGHECVYCYVPAVLHMTRKEFDAKAEPRKDFLEHAEKDARKYEAAGITAQVMLSFTTDPFNPFDTSLTVPTLELLEKYGMGFCTLTKAGTRAYGALGMFRPKRDAFASTLTTLDDAFSRKFERKAALPASRLAALQAYHNAGIFTWVSLEPTLDVEASLQIVQETYGYVDLFKIGRANYMGALTKTTDWRDYTIRMIELCQRLDVKHYIKRDLQQFLPAGYHNPKRIPQHH